MFADLVLALTDRPHVRRYRTSVAKQRHPDVTIGLRADLDQQIFPGVDLSARHRQDAIVATDTALRRR